MATITTLNSSDNGSTSRTVINDNFSALNSAKIESLSDLGVTASAAELNFVDGVTSAIQTQLNGKEATITSLAVSKGGTNITSYTAGDILYATGSTTLAKLAIGSAGQVLQVSSGLPAWASVAGTGDVTAASTIADNRLVRGDGGAKGIQQSGITVDDSNNLSGVGTLNTHTIPGGTGTIALTSDIPAAGANTALSNLASVAINAALVLGTSDAFALGSATKMWSDLFLASGAVINFDNGDVTLTHGANSLTLGGGDLALGANSLTMTGSIAATGARVTKGWFTDIESTNMPTVGGTSLSSTFAPIASPTFTGTVTVPATNFTVGASLPFSDSAGTLTLQNIDALDATTESTIEAAIDTLANLTSIQGQTVTLAGAFITSGANSLTLTTTGTTDVTLPTTGTLTTLAGAETLSNKTLTAPKFADAGFIADANGNELIIFGTTASAVNEFKITNGSTGVNPKFEATGEANVGIDFQAKGTGVYNFKSTSSQAAEIRLFEDTDDGSNYIAIKPPALAANYTLTLPTTDGNANEFLKTDGSGGLSWATAGALTSKARAYNSSAQNFATTTATKLQFQSESYDTNGEFDSTTNYRFTSTSGGTYVVHAQMSHSSGGAGIDNRIIHMHIYKNGSSVTKQSTMRGADATTNGYSFTVTDVISLAASDYIEIFVEPTSSTSFNTVNTSDRTYVTITQIQ